MARDMSCPMCTEQVELLGSAASALSRDSCGLMWLKGRRMHQLGGKMGATRKTYPPQNISQRKSTKALISKLILKKDIKDGYRTVVL